jgi:hypothetical protein
MHQVGEVRPVIPALQPLRGLCNAPFLKKRNRLLLPAGGPALSPRRLGLQRKCDLTAGLFRLPDFSGSWMAASAAAYFPGLSATDDLPADFLIREPCTSGVAVALDYTRRGSFR